MATEIVRPYGGDGLRDLACRWLDRLFGEPGGPTAMLPPERTCLRNLGALLGPGDPFGFRRSPRYPRVGAVQGGNVEECNETVQGMRRVLRGGSFNDDDLGAAIRVLTDPTSQSSTIGFRVAQVTPAPPACEVSPASLDFGTVSVGHNLDKTFTIMNTGAGVLSGSVSAPCNHYSIVSGGGVYDLGADESVVVTVRFEPSSVGQHNCTIETGNDLCSDVPCTGQGSQDEPIPTVSEWGMVVMALLVLTAGTLVYARRRPASQMPPGVNEQGL